MKRYSIRSQDSTKYAQFPAVDKAQAEREAKRHAVTLGIEDGCYRVSYVGKWHGEGTAEEYTVVGQ